MRVVHLTQYFMPWLGYVAYYLPRAQLQAGHEVTVVSSNLRWPGAHYGALAEEGVPREMPVGPSVERGVPAIRLPVSRVRPKGLFLKGLHDTLAELRPDVVVSYLYLAPTTLQAALAQARIGFRLVVGESALPHQARTGRVHEVARRVASEVHGRLVVPRTERVVQLAEGTRQVLLDDYRVPEHLLHFIPLGVDQDTFHPDPAARTSLRAEHGVAEGEFLVLYSGKITPVKRIELLIEAVGRIGGSKLWIVGQGDEAYRRSLADLADRVGADCRFHPGVPPPELARFFNAADVCAWPADCTISHLEAAACGRPIVIPADTGVDDRIEAGNGIAVPQEDPEALARTLGALRDDPARRARMSAAALKVTDERFGWPSIARRWDEVLGP